MTPSVLLKMGELIKGFYTVWAVVFLLTCVAARVLLQVGKLFKGLFAEWAMVLPLAAVHQQMLVHLSGGWKRFEAVHASERGDRQGHGTSRRRTLIPSHRRQRKRMNEKGNQFHIYRFVAWVRRFAVTYSKKQKGRFCLTHFCAFSANLCRSFQWAWRTDLSGKTCRNMSEMKVSCWRYDSNLIESSHSFILSGYFRLSLHL